MATRTFLTINEPVTYDTWSHYAAGLDVLKGQNRVVALSFSKVVSDEEMTTYFEALNKEYDGLIEDDKIGYQTFFNDAFPEDADIDHLLVSYVSPFSQTNGNAIGFDYLSEFKRRETALKARDTDQITTTGIIAGFPDPNVSAVLVMVPLYKKDKPHRTLDERRANFEGVVSLVYRADDVFNELLPESTFFKSGVEVFGIKPNGDEQVTYKTELARPTSYMHVWEVENEFESLGRKWGLRVTGYIDLPAFKFPLYAFYAVSSILTVVSFSLVLVQYRLKRI
jgi:hypothetical protein